MFPPLDIPFVYWIEHVTFGILYVLDSLLGQSTGEFQALPFCWSFCMFVYFRKPKMRRTCFRHLKGCIILQILVCGKISNFLFLCHLSSWWRHQMKTFSIFRVTGPLWGESTGPQRIPFTKASGTELWCFVWSAPVIWDTITLIMTSL